MSIDYDVGLDALSLDASPILISRIIKNHHKN